MRLQELLEARAPTEWNVVQVVQDILGAQNVALPGQEVGKGQYRIVQGEEGNPGAFSPPRTEPTPDWMKEFGMTGAEVPGTVFLKNLNSNEASDVAAAAHESYHAYMNMKSRGGMWQNEKYTNQMAERWLRKHLTGIALHVALETITHSRISYGHN